LEQYLSARQTIQVYQLHSASRYDAQLRTSLLSLSAQIFGVVSYGCMKITVPAALKK
jgi:hypothetical protein